MVVSFCRMPSGLALAAVESKAARLLRTKAPFERVRRHLNVSILIRWNEEELRVTLDSNDNYSH